MLQAYYSLRTAQAPITYPLYSLEHVTAAEPKDKRTAIGAHHATNIRWLNFECSGTALYGQYMYVVYSTCWWEDTTATVNDIDFQPSETWRSQLYGVVSILVWFFSAPSSENNDAPVCIRLACLGSEIG